MARPIEFDREEVLRKAIGVFWQKGYSGTSIKNLVEATGLQPGSIYSAFGDKRGLFLAAIDGYFDDMKPRVVNILHTDQTPIVRIENFFNRLINESVTDEHHKGCFLVNTLLEIPVDDQEINSRLQAMFGLVENEFRGVLEEHIASGEFDSKQSPEALARFLVAGIYGLRVFNKTQPDISALKSIVDNLLFVLRRKSCNDGI
ncbi:MAG: TetR/AcrR family transcriptional regulator [Methylobacter sp.]|nr:TetR/AcrR family transcriptional regulator [Methylobacter sp.]